jgi:gliding motility-associated-like protein
MLKNKYNILILFLLFYQFGFAQQPPKTVDDNYSTQTNITLTIATPGLLANDVDDDIIEIQSFSINGITYSVGETANLTEGAITIFKNGSFNFIPTNNYNGKIPEINYTISDGTFTNSANLNITIENLLSPEAQDDNFTTETNTTLNSTTLSILDNDIDADGNYFKVTEFLVNSLSYSAGETANFTEGAITINTNGTFNFIPANNYSGNTPIINYTISDGTFTNSANLNITVLSLFPPEAIDNYDTVEINTPLNVTALGLLSNDTDEDNNPLSIVEYNINGTTYVIGQTASLTKGSFILNADGSFTFTPTTDSKGYVPTINYTISDGTFTSSANLFLTIEPITDLIEISEISSCNQGYTVDGTYKIRYNLSLRNTSTARDYHPSSLIKKIDLTNNIDAIYGTGCVTRVDDVLIVTSNTIVNSINGRYPREFNDSAVNPDFLDATSNQIFNDNAINNFTLYPRQSISIQYCITIDPFCNSRPKPTPSGSGIDFENILNVTSSIGDDTKKLLLTDFHTTEAIVTAGLFIPNFKPTANPDGTYDYTNTVIIRNEGTAAAMNVNYNMGLENFLDNGISFNKLSIKQVSGPSVNINSSYDGDTNTQLLTPNNSLAKGETIVLEIAHSVAPFTSSRSFIFNQLDLSQTQGNLDGGIDAFDETTSENQKRYSFVTWSDSLGNHLDRYYPANTATDIISSTLQCNCDASRPMRFLFDSKATINKSILSIQESPNGILEHTEVTFQITITNTSDIIELKELQIIENLNSACGNIVNNVVSVTSPSILNSTAIITPTINGLFNGVTDNNIFNTTPSLLQVDESVTVQFSAIFNEDCIGSNISTLSVTNPANKAIKTPSNSVSINISTDSDNDLISNDNDLDDDNDTIPDTDEYNGKNPLDDHDIDLIPNYRDTDFGIDANNDGIVDIFDFDNDGVPNHFDLDSDNDGVLDIVEAGNINLDSTSDGTTNSNVGLNGLDNSVEINDTVSTSINYTIPNTDGNGNANFSDIDADGDGIVDNIEAQTTENYLSINTSISASGINTAYPNGITPIDTDNDTIFDYIDTNSDNDAYPDSTEGWDFDNNGTPETVTSNTDRDNDGLDDAYDTDNTLLNSTNGQTPTDFPNVDNVDNPERDWREIKAIVVLIDNASINEGGDLEFTISLVTKNDNSILVKSTFPISIDFSTVNGTTSADTYEIATAPFDYNKLTSLTFNFPPFTETSTFLVPTKEDSIFEKDELLTLNGIITSRNTITTEISGVATILNNDEPPSIAINNATADEGNNLVPTITISHPSSTPIEIDIITKDGLAISPEDYTTFSNTLTINGTIDPANPFTETSFNITTLTDNINEKDEYINILGVVTSANVGLTDLMKIGTIIDINPDPIVAINNVTAIEGGVLEFTITLLNVDSEPMTNYLPIYFDLESISETANVTQDFQKLVTSSSIPAFQSSLTQTVLTLEDKLIEESETMLLQATINSAGVSNTSSVVFGQGTIKDNDFPNLFSPNDDGKSDLFKLPGMENFPNFKLIIMDRWGSQVYNYSNKGDTNPTWWDGRYKGEQAIEGVYYYTLDFNDGITPPKTNFIQLIR